MILFIYLSIYLSFYLLFFLYQKIEYLQWCRNLHFKPTAASESCSDWFSDVDAAAMEYLFKFNNNISRAMFYLEVDLYCGKGKNYRTSVLFYLFIYFLC